MDTLNKFLVGCSRDEIIIRAYLQVLSRDDALNLAAWLVTIADREGKFNELLEAVQNT